jgi:hypothetical protein
MTYYSVNAFAGTEFIFQSHQFSSEEEALNLLNNLTSTSTSTSLSFHVYKSTPMLSKESLVPEYDDLDFSTMTLSQYGKGLLLTPTDGDSLSGTKYFHGGFWMPSQDSWFFKMPHYEFLVDNGANDVSGVEYINSVDVKPICERFEKMSVIEHGKGYLMTCDHKSNPLHGEKYLTQPKGYWNPTLKGWTFSSKALTDLTDQGAVYVGAETASEINIYDNMTVTNYGRGLLMTCDQKSNPLRGEKYLHNPTGYWNATLQGWVFASTSMDDVINQGAVYVAEAEAEALFQGMKYRAYGKGYLLMSHGDDRAGRAYDNGVWIPKVDGWFFKKTDKSFLRENGARKTKYITPEFVDTDE